MVWDTHTRDQELEGLTRAVNRLAEELAAARREVDRGVADLERAGEAMSEIAVRVSHDLRTPLTAIQGFSELMSRGRLSADAMRQYAADINRDARRLADLISVMFDADGTETGRIAMHRALLQGRTVAPGPEIANGSKAASLA